MTEQQPPKHEVRHGGTLFDRVYVTAKGEFPKADKLYAKYKNGKDGDIPLRSGVTMTGPYNKKTGYTRFEFVINTYAIKQAIAAGEIIGRIERPLHPSMVAYYQVLLSHATLYWEQIISCYPRYLDQLVAEYPDDTSES